MKLQLLLFFAFVTPVVLFFASIMYGGASTENMKKAIAASGAYSQIGEYFSRQDADAIAHNQDYTVIVSKRLTPPYIQTKTELLLDDSANWITGKTQTTPVLSFKELKEELQSEHGDLMRRMEYVPTKADLNKLHLNAHEQARYLEQAKKLRNFANADFTLPLGNQLEGIKLAYKILQIGLPILLILLICSLILLINFSDSLPAKFTWIGSTLLASSMAGYGCIFFHPYLDSAIMATHLLQESDFLSLFSPIILAMINYYVNIYVGYQEIVNIIFLAGAAGCFLGALVTKNSAGLTVKPVYEIPSYWQTPLEEHKAKSVESKENKE